MKWAGDRRTLFSWKNADAFWQLGIICWHKGLVVASLASVPVSLLPTGLAQLPDFTWSQGYATKPYWGLTEGLTTTHRATLPRGLPLHANPSSDTQILGQQRTAQLGMGYAPLWGEVTSWGWGTLPLTQTCSSFMSRLLPSRSPALIKNPTMWFSGYFFLILSVIVEVSLWWKLQASLIFLSRRNCTISIDGFPYLNCNSVKTLKLLHVAFIFLFSVV